MPVSSPSSNGGKDAMNATWRRKKKIKTPPGHPSDADLIAQWLTNGGQIEKCAAGVAKGSMFSSDHGLSGS